MGFLRYPGIDKIFKQFLLKNTGVARKLFFSVQGSGLREILRDHALERFLKDPKGFLRNFY